MSGPLLHAAPAVIPGGMLAFVPIAPAPAEPALQESEALHADEHALAMSMTPRRRVAFTAGRIALRAALQAVRPSLAHATLLQSPRGAPLLPPGVTGSVSHKMERAVALVAPYADRHVGVDLEHRPREGAALRPSELRRALASRILTPREQRHIALLDDIAHREVTLLHFALKEAVYKAIDPFVQRFVRFTEVELDLGDIAGVRARESGDAAVTPLLPECAHTPLSVRAAWHFEGDWIVAVANATRP